LIGETVLFELLAGDAIATTGTASPVPVNGAVVGPNALVQTIGTENAPFGIVNELLDGLVEFAPLTVQVVPAGIVVPPLTV